VCQKRCTTQEKRCIKEQAQQMSANGNTSANDKTHMHAHTHIGPAAHAMIGLPRHPGDDSWQMQHAATHYNSALQRHSRDAYWHAHCSSKISPKTPMGMEKKNPVCQFLKKTKALKNNAKQSKHFEQHKEFWHFFFAKTNFDVVFLQIR